MIVNAHRKWLKRKKGRNFTDAELAEHLGCSEMYVTAVLEAKPCDLEAMRPVRPPHPQEDKIMRCYLDPSCRTLEEIGQKFGMTRSTVQRIAKKHGHTDRQVAIGKRI